MSNCFDYLAWRGDLSFYKSDFNEVDGMILSRFSYAPLELIGESGVITVEKACRDLELVPEIEKKLVIKNDLTLIKALKTCERFNKLRIIEYESFREEESQTQFSAVTFPLGNGIYYIAFRGTDDTLVGWKEDFNMSFISPVPAQKLAVEYYERVASRLRGRFILGGHSKGGNLAVYAAAFSSAKYRRRVIRVENFDGPGFDERVLETGGYKEICPLVSTYVPQSSVVGLLLGHEEDYVIVKSANSGILQHDTYSWEIERDRFIYLEKVTDASKFLDSTLKEWIAEMPADKREKLVDTIYTMLSQTNAKTIKELGENWVLNTASILRAVRELDPETRKLFNEALRSLAKGAKRVAAKLIYEK